MYVNDILNVCLMYMCYSSVMCMNGTMSFCVRCFSHALGLIHDLTFRLLYLCFHMFRSICSIECIDHMFYVELIVCIICIHMITLGSPCKRHEVLVRVGMTRIAKQEVLPRVGMTRIGKQGVMARVGRTRIVMHWRLPRGKCVSDRELAYIMVGLGEWLDIDSNRAGYTGCVCTLEEFLIYHRCWLCMFSYIYGGSASLRDYVLSNRVGYT